MYAITVLHYPLALDELLDTDSAGTAVVEHYAHLRTALESAGTPIGAIDMRIAAHARSLGAIIVTNNVRHFSGEPALTIENW